MKNLFKTFGFSAIAAYLVISASLTSSCGKDKPTQVLVTVIDTTEKPVAEATVRVYAKPSNGSTVKTLFDTQILSDGNGQALFDYSSYTKPGQAGFVVLDIEVNTPDGQFGVGVVKVEEEKRNEKLIIVQ